MLHRNPIKRVSSTGALKILNGILTDTILVEERKENDGAYFDFVIQDIDICTLPDDLDVEDADVSNIAVIGPRPLHFVATFDRDKSIGLVLSEPDAVNDGEDYEHDDTWNLATTGAHAGDVFVRDIVEGGQADEIGIFEIGDRIAGVGEFPHEGSGFEGFVSMLNAVPQK